jgi:hypothetical protein
MRRPWPTGGCCAKMRRNKKLYRIIYTKVIQMEKGDFNKIRNMKDQLMASYEKIAALQLTKLQWR